MALSVLMNQKTATLMDEGESWSNRQVTGEESYHSRPHRQERASQVSLDALKGFKQRSELIRHSFKSSLWRIPWWASA